MRGVTAGSKSPKRQKTQDAKQACRRKSLQTKSLSSRDIAVPLQGIGLDTMVPQASYSNIVEQPPAEMGFWGRKRPSHVLYGAYPVQVGPMAMVLMPACSRMGMHTSFCSILLQAPHQSSMANQCRQALSCLTKSVHCCARPDQVGCNSLACNPLLQTHRLTWGCPYSSSSIWRASAEHHSGAATTRVMWCLVVTFDPLEASSAHSTALSARHIPSSA